MNPIYPIPPDPSDFDNEAWQRYWRENDAAIKREQALDAAQRERALGCLLALFVAGLVVAFVFSLSMKAAFGAILVTAVPPGPPDTTELRPGESACYPTWSAAEHDGAWRVHFSRALNCVSAGEKCTRIGRDARGNYYVLVEGMREPAELHAWGHFRWGEMFFEKWLE